MNCWKRERKNLSELGVVVALPHTKWNGKCPKV